MVDVASGAHSLQLVHPGSLETLLTMPFSQGHEINAVARTLLPTSEFGFAPAKGSAAVDGDVAGKPEQPQAWRREAHAARAAAAPLSPRAAAAGVANGQADPNQRAEAMVQALPDPVDGDTVVSLQDSACTQQFVCREHLLVPTTAYHTSGAGYTARDSGATQAMHLLSVMRPRLEYLAGEAKAWCALHTCSQFVNDLAEDPSNCYTVSSPECLSLVF
jgi:hypothetical protein